MSMFKIIEYPRNILLKMGIWPQTHFNPIYRLRAVFSMGNVFLLLFCLAYNAFIQIDDFVKFSKSLYLFISIFNTSIKFLILSVNGETLLKLYGLLNKASFKNFNQLYASTINEFTRMFNRLQSMYLFIATGFTIFVSLIPVLESKSLPMDFPFFNDGIFHYPFYFFELFAIYITAWNNIAIDFVTVGFILVGAMQLTILNNKLMDTEKNISSAENGTDNEDKILEYLVECCNHYSDVEEYIKCLQEVFSTLIFVQMGSSVVALCNSGMMIFSVEPFSVEAISIVFYLVGMLGQLGLYCSFGDFVYAESLKITTSCYLSPWYKHNMRVKKTLFMLMERSKKPIEVKGLNFIVLSFNSFIVILKWSYSYFALLRNYTNQQNQ